MFKKIALLCGALACTMMTAQTPASAAGNDEQEVAAAVEKLRQVMVDPDLKTLEALTAADLSYGHSNGKVQTKAEFIDDLKTGASDFVKIALSDQTIKVDGDTAIVRHALVAETNDSGKPGNVSLKILMVWKKQHGHWQLLARQAVRFTA
jgi:ketosteroid isomerase-like protein